MSQRLLRNLKLPNNKFIRIFSRIFEKKSIQASFWIVLSMIFIFHPVFFNLEVVSTDINLKYFPYIQYQSKDYIFDSDLRSDMLDSYYPSTNNYFQDIKEGRFASWDNNQKLGIPTDVILKNHSPVSLLNLFLPIEFSLTIEILIKFFLGGFFLYLLLKEFGLRHYPSIFGAVIFMYSGYNIVWFWNFASTANLMIPMFLFGIYKLSKGEFKYFPFIIFSASYALLAGFVAGAVYLLCIGGFFTLFLLVREIINKKPWKNKNEGMQILKNYSFIFFSTLIGISLAIFTLVPTLEWLERVDVGYRISSNLKENLPRFDILPQLIMPYFNGGVFIDSYFGKSNYNETTGYIGVIPTILFLFGCVVAIIKRKWKFIFFIIIFLFAFLAVYKIGPVLELLVKLPIFNSSSNIRLISLIGLTGAIVSAYGLNEFWKIDKKVSALSIKSRVFIFLSITIPITLVLLFTINLNLDSISNIVLDEGQKMIIMMLNLITIIHVILSFLLVLFRKNLRINLKTLLVFFVVVSFLELFFYSQRQISTLPRNLHYPITEGIEYLINNTQELERIVPVDFAMGPRGTEVYYDLHALFDHDLYTIEERSYYEKLFIPDTKIWATRTFPLVLSNNLNFGSDLLDELNVKFLVFPPGWSPESLAGDMRNEFEENFEEVFFRENDLKIYINKDGYSLTHFTNNKSAKVISSELINDGHQIFKVTSDTNNTFYTSELYYKNWKVYVNGQESTLTSIGNLFKAVEIPSGEVTVEFIYQPSKLYYYGGVYTVFIYILILVFIVFKFISPYIKKIYNLYSQKDYNDRKIQ